MLRPNDTVRNGKPYTSKSIQPDSFRQSLDTATVILYIGVGNT